MSLYRTYRPLDFKSLLGQDHVREVLQAAIEQGRVSHAYLFTGPRGTGKTSTARILARAINCLEIQDAEPCNHCDICRAALEERLTDLIEIDAASHGLVDDARALVEQARFMPVQAKKKIYIIDEVHMLSKSAFNALLKIIEEPPDHVHFILATTEAHKVLETVQSRCLRFDFHLADEALIAAHLQEVCSAEGVSASPEALMVIAQQARGSFRDSLSLLEQVMGQGDITEQLVLEILGLSEKTVVLQFLEALKSSDREKALAIIHDLSEQGSDLYLFCQSVLQRLRQELLTGSLSQQTVLQWVDIFFQALDQLRDPVIPELPLEVAVVKCLPSQFQVPSAKFQVPSSKLQTTTNHQPAFDSARFISSIKHASLRSLLKASELQFADRELTITAGSQFELEKLRKPENQAVLMGVLKTLVGSGAFFSFRVAENKKTLPTQPSGLSTQDLQSVFD